MNLKEAYSILEISPEATPEEAKKQYRKLTKQYHPDVNKEPDAEAKFKKINEAYQIVSTGKSTDREEMHWQTQQGGFNPFSGFGGPIHQEDNVHLETTISFKESILGCTKELKITRKHKCVTCEGKGTTPLPNGCLKCGGKGEVSGRRGNMIFTSTCTACGGRVSREKCKTCSGKGREMAESTITVAIPPGVPNDATLRLDGVGHFVGNFMMMDQYTNALLHVHVTAEEGLSLVGKDVVYTLELSLLDALKGCDKEINTIKGLQTVQVPPLSRNREEIIMPGLGVAGKGNQRVVLDVRYPEDVNHLIAALNESLNWKVN